MNPDQEYFLKILSEILPEVASYQTTVGSYKETGDHKWDRKSITDSDQSPKILYFEGGDTLDSISIPPAAEIEIQTDLIRINQFYKSVNISLSGVKVLASFKELKKPAIIHEPQNKVIYLLFDLKRLICRLSKLEHEFDKRDHLGRFLAAYLEHETNWKYPVLDILCQLIREKLGFPIRKEKHGIVITHDVDRVGLEPLLLLKNIFRKKELNLLYFAKKRDRLFQKIMELAETDTRHKIKPVWFYLSGKYSLKRYGNRYNIGSTKSKKLIALITKSRHHIGLHTSFYAAFNADETLSEKKKLAEYSNQPIALARNHYLRFDIKKSIPILEYCGIALDSTIGFPDKNGFRAAISRPFYPWNHSANRTSKVLELPLLYMDSVNGDDLPASWDDVLRILYWIKRVRGCGAFLFHPCFIAESEEKQEFYLNFIQECGRMDIPFIAADEINSDRLLKRSRI
jgi:hypothetical protein